MNKYIILLGIFFFSCDILDTNNSEDDIYNSPFNYSLEDINPNSPSFGEMIGPSYFARQGKATVHIFSHQN